MKEIIFSALILILLVFSCETKTYKYRIEGYTKSPTEWDKYKGYHSAVAYTDTFELTKDSVWYYNSNKSKVTLYKYKIFKLK